MMRKLLIGKILLFILFFCFILKAQSQDTLKNKNVELNKIKGEISRLENELKSKSQKEKESLRVIENINRQNLLLGKVINSLIAEEQQKESELAVIENDISKIENRISSLREKYSRYIIWVYKNRGRSMLGFLLNTRSFNQAVKRYQYFKFISSENKKTIAELNLNKSELNYLRLELEREKEAKERFVRQKLSEQQKLEQKENDRKKILALLRNDQKSIAEEISLKRKAEVMIKSMIAKLVEYDRERKNKERENKAVQKKFTQTFDYSKFENFGELKGKLGWPIRSGSIVRSFGENKNEKLKTVTLNYGIDILINNDQDVLAVAEGIVSAIDWIPGYGSIIIITHRDEHRTVYGHVANISVREGDRVKAGKSLGKVNESLEGKILHFEIWNERNYQNPSIWLTKR